MCPPSVFLMGVFLSCFIIATPQDLFLAATVPHFGVHDVGILDLQNETTRLLSLNNLLDPVGVDFDPQENKIYFSDRSTGIIGRVNLNGTKQETLITFGNKTSLEHIALNPWSRLLFWVDSGKGAIFVSNLQVTVWKKLIYGDLVRPRGLVADNNNSYIYWSEWADFDVGNQAKIERATMSGDDREVLVRESLVWPNGITLDRTAGRLYWCDAYLDKIESVNFDGSNRTLIIESSSFLQHSYSIAIFDNILFWSDARQRAIVKSSESAGNRTYSLLPIAANRSYGINGLIISLYEIGNNACSRDNGGCFTSQLCLPKPSGRNCACLESRNDDDTCFYITNGPPATVPGITVKGCPGDTTITLTTDKDSITVTWVEPTATNADGGVLTADQSHRPGEAFSEGTTTVIYVYDYNGRTAICSFDVTVNAIEDTTTDRSTLFLAPSVLIWAGIGTIALLLCILLLICLVIYVSCFPRKKASRRDGNLVAMEGLNDASLNTSTNTLTSQTSLAVNGSFRKPNNIEKSRKKYNRKRNNPNKMVAVDNPQVHDYAEVAENRFVDGSTNFENSGRFNTLR